MSEQTPNAVPPPGTAQAPKDTPFGLEQNVAAGLAYLFCLIGGIVMLVGGGTNKFVRWAAAQSIVLWVAFVLLRVVLGFLWIPLWQSGLWTLYLLLSFVVNIAWLVAWLWTFISAFQGKEVRVPIVAGITDSIFKAAL